jgi:hypothetical protein
MTAQRRKTPYSGTPIAYAAPTLQEARALHSLEKGEATSEQQKVALKYIFTGACGAGREDLSPGNPDVTAYNAGRKSVIYQIGWVLGQPADNFRTGEKD